ncbi:MAG: alcohol dehydrogenase catalytic domain-containing protein, partial [Victivallales bacterium]|nr:alcohol dehydrogenase catalytic domain-containing protein [Victivallales bacterium]
MKTTALRIYGKMDLRLESFELPPCGDDGIIAEVVSDSICMSSYKASKAGEDHKRVPNDCATNPPILGHEFTGRIIEVGKKWQDQFKPGDRFGIQPAMPIEGSYAAPGYSFQTIGGDSTYIRIPSIVMEHGCLLKYTGDAFFMASLSEPMSCLIGACHAQYHIPAGTYHHNMGVVEGGACACLASAGPMGLGLIDYLVHGPRKPGLVVVTDI